MAVIIKIDTREFDKTFKEYMRYSSRSFAEACNQHAYYIARNGTLVTKAAGKQEIQEGLMGPSRKFPQAPLAAVIVNSQRKTQGKKGLNGEKMSAAIVRLIKKRQNHRNFLRAGWIPAIKLLATIVKKKNGTPIPPGTQKKGRNFGGAKPANERAYFNWSPMASIWNQATGKIPSEKAIRFIEEGAQKAVEMETQSMRTYIEKKQQEASNRFW